MTAVYAKIRKSFIAFLGAAAISVMLSGCLTGGGYAGLPWFGSDTGVVTKDPEVLPDIAWQTNNQRQELSAEARANRPSLQTIPGAAPVLGKGVTVAILLPLTGKSANMGQAMLKAAQMALFDVGSANFNLVPKDTQSTPSGAAAAAQQAVSEKADLILGPVFADDLKMVKPIATAANIPVVSFTTDWTQAGSGVYVTGFMPFAQVSRVVQYAQSKGVERFAVFAPQTPYADVALSTLQRAGATIVKSARYAPSQPDISQTVEAFVGPDKANLSFDALVLPVGGESLGALVSVFDGAGVSNKTTRLIGTGLWDDEALNRNPALHGGWFAAPDPALRRDFERRYQENYGEFPPRLTSLAYDSTALAAVLARSGDAPFSREKMTNGRGFAGIDGLFRFRSDGLTDRGLAVLEIQQGKARVIDPAPTAFATAGM